MTDDERLARLRHMTAAWRRRAATGLTAGMAWLSRVPRETLALAATVPAVLAIGLAGTGYRYDPATIADLRPSAADQEQAERSAAEETTRQRMLRRRLDRLVPRQTFIVVDQTRNRLYVRKGNEVLLETVCSAGSGGVLQDVGTGRQWTFDTPRGRFRVRGKIRNPIWRKPDWAFVETGEPIPTDPALRLERGTLGEYALDLGDGYLIHGTLYERLLGRSVTHGCVRLGREDLRQVYKVSPVGTPVFIF